MAAKRTLRMGSKARGARSGHSTQATSNTAAHPQSRFPYGFRRAEYIVASLANDQRHWTRLAPRLRACAPETRLMRIDEMGASKSARKREVLALQALGEQLIDLTEDQLRDMELDESLFDAVIVASKIKSRSALRRQYQLIGKLMRNVDPEPIRCAIEAFQRQEKTDKAVFRRAENWRDRIVQGQHESLNEFFEMTGNMNGDLIAMLNEYLASSEETARRALRRKIFRQVHEELTAVVQNCAG